MSSFFSSGRILDEPFDAAKFTANGAMTWTVALGDILEYRYSLVGKIMTVWLGVNSTSTVGGAVNTTLHVRIPGGFTAKTTSASTGIFYNNATYSVGKVITIGGDPKIYCQLINSANYVLGATSVLFTFPLEVA